MTTIIVLLRLIGIIFGIIGAFTLVIGVGFLLISIMQDLYNLSYKIEQQYQK